MVLEDEILTTVLFGSIRWEMNARKILNMNMKHYTRKDSDPDLSVWLGYISHENKHRPAGLEPGGMKLVNGKQASGRCVSLGIVIQSSPSVCTSSG